MTAAPATRCGWAKSDLSIPYHDAEWGKPVHDDRVFFEYLVLDGAQAGLSWETILRKREHYRRLFHDFDPVRVARIGAARIETILTDPGIVRNRAKVASAVTNAKAFLELQREFGSFDAYVWRFVGGKTIDTRPRRSSDIPTESEESRALSKDLRARGFSFVGPTIMYAFMQAAGLVNDHVMDCAWAGRRGL